MSQVQWYLDLAQPGNGQKFLNEPWNYAMTFRLFPRRLQLCCWQILFRIRSVLPVLTTRPSPNGDLSLDDYSLDNGWIKVLIISCRLSPWTFTDSSPIPTFNVDASLRSFASCFSIFSFSVFKKQRKLRNVERSSATIAFFFEKLRSETFRRGNEIEKLVQRMRKARQNLYTLMRANSPTMQCSHQGSRAMRDAFKRAGWLANSVESNGNFTRRVSSARSARLCSKSFHAWTGSSSRQFGAFGHGDYRWTRSAKLREYSQRVTCTWSGIS